MCPEHIEEYQPYVVGVLVQIASMNGEEERVKRYGFRGVDVRGLLAEELVIKLNSDHNGAVTVERISREIMRHPLVVAAIFVSLARAGRVDVRRTERGSIMVTTRLNVALLGSEVSNPEEESTWQTLWTRQPT